MATRADEMTVRVDSKLLNLAVRTANARCRLCKIKEYRDNLILSVQEHASVPGAIAEAAFAKMMGLPWDCRLLMPPEMSRLFTTWDVCGYMIRATKHRGGMLLCHKRDQDERPFVLAYVSGDTVRFAGWMYGEQAKTYPFKEFESRPGHPCYQVPRSELTPLRGSGILPRTAREYLALPCLIKRFPCNHLDYLAIPTGVPVVQSVPKIMGKSA